MNILVLDKIFYIIYIYYLFGLRKLLKKRINLTVLKRNLYKYKKKIKFKTKFKKIIVK